MRIRNLILLITFFLIPGHLSLLAESHSDALRMIVYPNEKFAYKVDGKALFDMPTKIIVSEYNLGARYLPAKVLKMNRFTRFTGVQFAFVHPLYAGLKKNDKNGKEIEVDNYSFFGLEENKIFVTYPIKLMAKATWTKTGWTYKFELAEAQKGKICVNPNFGAYLVEKFDMRVQVIFDNKKKRVKSAKITHKWKLKRLNRSPEEEEAIIKAAAAKVAAEAAKAAAIVNARLARWSKMKSNKVIKEQRALKKQEKKDVIALAKFIKNQGPGEVFKEKIAYTFSLKFDGNFKEKKIEKKNGVIILNPEHQKAIDRGVVFLMKRIQDPAWSVVDPKNHTTVGEIALAFFAVLRAGKNPDDPIIEKELQRFVVFAKAQGYEMGKTPPNQSGYATGCILMMCEAALNPMDTDKISSENVDNTGDRNYRGSEILQMEILELAKHCVFMYKANVKMSGKYGKTASTTARGHLWGYNCQRGAKGGPHYSPAQYAVLGLRCAKLLGIPVHPNVWEDIHKKTIKDYFTFDEKALAVGGMNQTASYLTALKGSKLDLDLLGGPLSVEDGEDILHTTNAGAWGYNPSGTNIPMSGHGIGNFNMVCAALGNMAMAYSFDRKNVQKNDHIYKDTKKQMAAGLHFCQLILKHQYKNLSLYEYYSWERVAVFYGIEKINGKDWHKIMGDKIVAAQNKKTGEMKGTGYAATGTMGTSYGVLFLKKATKKLNYQIIAK